MKQIMYMGMALMIFIHLCACSSGRGAVGSEAGGAAASPPPSETFTAAMLERLEEWDMLGGEDLRISQPLPVYDAESGAVSSYTYFIFDGAHICSAIFVSEDDIAAFDRDANELHFGRSDYTASADDDICALYEKLLADEKAFSFISYSEDNAVVYQEGCMPVTWIPEAKAGEVWDMSSEELVKLDHYEKQRMELQAVETVIVSTEAPETAEGPYDRYFTDNTDYVGDSTLICYSELPYESSRGFDDQRARLEADGAIPELPMYDSFSASAMYHADGSFYEVLITWQNYVEGVEYKQLSLMIVPGDMGDPKVRDGVFVPDENHVTKTVVDGVTVYGSGTVEPKLIGDRPSQCNALVFEKDGMRYQMDCIRDTTLEELGAVLDFYLETDLDLSAFSMELGDEYTVGLLEDYGEAFAGCIPEIGSLPLYREESGVSMKNGLPTSVELYFTSTETEYNGTDISLSINKAPDTWILDDDLGELHALTWAEIETALEEHGEAGFWVGENYIHVWPHPDTTTVFTMALISTLPDFPAEESIDYFRDNSGQQGEYLSVIDHMEETVIPSRDFSLRTGELIGKRAMPVIRDMELSTLSAEYGEDGSLRDILMRWTQKDESLVTVEVLEACIYPPEIAETGDKQYQVDLDLCTKTEISGIAIYTDGTANTEKGAIVLLPDGGQCHIYGGESCNIQDVTAVLDWIAENGIDYENYAMELGDELSYVRREEIPTGISLGVPKRMPEDLNLEGGTVRLRDGEPYSFYGSVWQVTKSNEWMAFSWTVLTEHTERDCLLAAGDADRVTLEEVEERFKEWGDMATFFHGGLLIRVQLTREYLGAAGDIYAMLKALSPVS